MKNNVNIEDNNIKKNYKESWLFFYKYYKKNKKWTFLIMFISIIISLATISLPFFTQLISESVSSNGNIKDLMFLSCFLVGIALLKIILTFFSNYVSGVFDVKVEIMIRKEMMDNLHYLSMEQFDNSPTGIYFSRILSDLKEVKLYTSNLIQNITTIFCLIVGGFSFIFYIHWEAGLITLSIYLITLIIYILFKNNLAYHQQINKALNTSITIGLGERIQMISEIKSYNNSKSTIEQFDKLQENYFNSTKKYIKKSSFIKLVGIGASVLVSTAILIIGSYLTKKGIIKSSELLGLVMASNILILPIEKTALTSTDLITLNAIIVRIKEFYSWKFEINNGTITKKINGEVEFQDVSFLYNLKNNKISAFKNFNLKCEKNKKTLIYGNSSVGKTTIFKLLMRYYEIDSGKILIDGINLKDYDINYLRENIAYQSYEPKLFSSSLQLKTLHPDIDRYNKIANVLEIEELVLKKSKIDKNINSQGLQVSDSEKQMLSIARALYFDAAIVLFDFAECHLDKNQMKAVEHALDIFAKNKTIIFTGYKKIDFFKFDNYIKI